jgi:hemoglobin-like flavoprotein
MIDTRRLLDHRLLCESLDLVAPVAHDLVAAFYQELFAAYPAVRPLFPADMQPQQDKLLKAIIALVTHYDRPEQLIPALTTMGRNHVRYGAQLGHYAAVGSTLMSVLRRFAGDAWSSEYDEAWERAYTFAAGTMMMAALAAAEAEVPNRMAA